MHRIWVDVEDLFIYASSGLRPTGIQRVEFELCRALAALTQSQGRVFFVRHDARKRRLATVPWAEVETLFDAMSNTAEAQTPLPLRKRLWRKVYRRLPIELQLAISAFVTRCRQLSEIAAASHFDDSADTRAGDILLCLGSPWITRDYFSYVELAVCGKRLRLALLVHDIIPLWRPEWFDALNVKTFRSWCDGALSLADIIFTVSAATAADVARHARRKGLPLRASPQPIPVGTGFRKPPAQQRPRGAGVPSRLPAAGAYALIVSTIEPRKNHALLLAVWRLMLDDMPASEVPALVFAGRAGWLAADFMQQLKNCNFLDGKIIHIKRPTDEELEALYDGCLFTLLPSFYEGWGLPVTESLALGRPCIISKTTSLPEAAGRLARYIDPYNVRDAYRVIRDTIENRGGLAEWRDRVVREFRPVAWSQSANAMLQAFDSPGSAAPLTEAAE